MTRVRRIELPWNGQPQEQVGVDQTVWPGPSQVLLPSLAYAGVIGSGAISGANANSPFSNQTPCGIAMGWRPNSSTVPGEFYTWTCGDFDVGNDASMLAILAPISMADGKPIIEYGGANWGLTVGFSSATNAQAQYVDNPTSASYAADLTVPNLPDGVFRVVGMTKKGSTIKVFSRGQMATSSGGNGGIRRSAGSGLGYQFATGIFFYGRVPLAAITSRVLSDEQMLDLTRNESAPWKIFTPQIIHIPVSTGAAPVVPSITAVYADSVGTDRATPRVTLDYA